MISKLLIAAVIVLLAMPAWSADRNLGPESDQLPTENHEGELGNGARFLINDGSFEFGECDAGSAWTCITNTDCSWIVDPLPTWGYPAYDGVLVAWLGGFCGSDPNSNSFCQDLYISTDCTGGVFITWQWMGYVAGDDGNMMYITIDGTVVYQKELGLSDHTYGTWLEDWADANAYEGTRNFCFEFVATTGANMLVDYISNFWSPTAVEKTNLSTIKSRY